MDDEALQLLIDEGVIDENDEQVYEDAGLQALPTLPPVALRPPRVYTPKERISSTGKTYTYGQSIRNYMENGGFLHNVLRNGQ